MTKILMVSPFVDLDTDTGNKVHQENLVKNLLNLGYDIEWIVQGGQSDGNGLKREVAFAITVFLC